MIFKIFATSRNIDCRKGGASPDEKGFQLARKVFSVISLSSLVVNYQNQFFALIRRNLKYPQYPIEKSLNLHFSLFENEQQCFKLTTMSKRKMVTGSFLINF
jgi:hypothetical protein